MGYLRRGNTHAHRAQCEVNSASFSLVCFHLQNTSNTKSPVENYEMINAKKIPYVSSPSFRFSRCSKQRQAMAVMNYVKTCGCTSKI